MRLLPASSVALALATGAFERVVAEHWAVIVAGSQGYWNYRHQADACHAYHVVRRHGIPEENVVVMMYDDIAQNQMNPFKGKIFNRPANASSGEGPLEVYEGCKIDYRGDDVTPENFLSVLLGNATATNGKKVLQSGADDRVFVNFVDHGGSGIVSFPNEKLLTATDLTATLEKMYEQKRYKELVFYVEACESGSMFLDEDMTKINAFVTTAANATESSWGYFCPPMDIIDGQSMNTCLGDLYSLNWMADSDRTDLSAETLREQFRIVKAQTNLSHVKAFGPKHIRHEIVGNFQSNYDEAPSSTGSDDSDDNASDDHSHLLKSDASHPSLAGAVKSRDVNVVLAFYKYLRSASGPERETFAKELIREIESRERADRLFEKIRAGSRRVNHSGASPTKAQKVACRDAMFKAFKEECGDKSDEEIGIGHGFTSYSLQYAQDLAQMCDTFGDISTVRAVLRETCGHETKLAAENGVVFDGAALALA